MTTCYMMKIEDKKNETLHLISLKVLLAALKLKFLKNENVTQLLIFKKLPYFYRTFNEIKLN